MSKRLVVFGGITLLLMVLSGCGRHDGPWNDKGMSDFFLKRLDSKVEELNLTPVQKEKYGQLRASLNTRISEAKADREKFRAAFRAETAKEIPNIEGLTATMKTKIQDVSASMQSDLDALAAFYGSLDDSQKRKVATGIRERINRRRPCEEEEK